MFIKHLIGARAGEIEDVEFEGARRKVEAGQAEDVYRQLRKKPSEAVIQPEVVSTRVDAVALGAKKKRQ